MKHTKSVFLKPGKERTISNKHPWLFSGAVLKKDKYIELGDEVIIKDHHGQAMAKGHWCADDGLVCRILSFDPGLELDDHFIRGCFNQARIMRKRFGFPNPSTTGYRLIHAEGDGLSGLVCDIFGDSASIHLVNPGLKRSITCLADFLAHDMGIKNIHLYDFLTDESRWLVGHGEAALFVESGLSFVTDIEKGQKTGHFFDQRDNRELVRMWSSGRRVLDSFCYSGGFSVYALAGHAHSVTSVDIAENAINLCKKNVAANGFSERHSAVVADCFSHLRQIKKDEFDVIILDPPAFAKSAHAVDRAARGYKDINLLAFKAIAQGGLVLTFSCSHHVDEDLFQKIIFAAAKDAGREVKIVKKFTQGVDHPVSVYCPQSFYLKGLALYVV